MKPEPQNSLLGLVLVAIELRTIAAQLKHHRSDNGLVAQTSQNFNITRAFTTKIRINFSVRKLESKESFITDNSNVSSHNRQRKKAKKIMMVIFYVR